MKLSECIHSMRFVWYQGRPRRIKTLVAQLETTAGELALMLWDAIPPNEQSNSIAKLEEYRDSLVLDNRDIQKENETLRKELSFFFTEGYIDALLKGVDDE